VFHNSKKDRKCKGIRVTPAAPQTQRNPTEREKNKTQNGGKEGGGNGLVAIIEMREKKKKRKKENEKRKVRGKERHSNKKTGLNRNQPLQKKPNKTQKALSTFTERKRKDRKDKRP